MFLSSLVKHETNSARLIRQNSQGKKIFKYLVWLAALFLSTPSEVFKQKYLLNSEVWKWHRKTESYFGNSLLSNFVKNTNKASKSWLSIFNYILFSLKMFASSWRYTFLVHNKTLCLHSCVQNLVWYILPGKCEFSKFLL